MSDKLKEIRDKNPILDFLAGFIPGVGEALDIHDFSHAAKNNDFGGMALAAIGLGLPVVSGGLVKKIVKKLMDEPLPDGLRKNGWTVADDGAFVNKEGTRFIREDGKLRPESDLGNYRQTKQYLLKLDASKKAAKEAAEKEAKLFNDAVKDFKKETGLDFSLENWQHLAPGHKMTDIEKKLYTTQAFPKFVESYKQLKANNKIKKVGNDWYGWFDEAVSDEVSDRLPLLKKNWDKGWRKLDGKEGAMTYIIVHSEQGKGKFLYNGITMHQGIPELKDKISARSNFEAGDLNFPKWFDSDRSGAPEYSNPNGARGGLKIFGLPIRPSLVYPGASDKVHLIKRQTTNPTSNNWNGVGSWIGSHISKNHEKKVHISEGPLIDLVATKSQGHPVKGVFTVVGENIPIKSVFGGSGMYSVEGKNLLKPFMQFAAPIGLTSLIGYKAYDKSKE